MIVFENSGEIDPRLISLIGVNVKERSNPVGYFGTGLKYAVACLARWGESLTVQSGAAEFTFCTEEQRIRGQTFGVIVMRSAIDHLQLGFTTDLGKRWEPWMVYRELWCNAHDEPDTRVYVAPKMPAPTAGITRVIASGPKIERAHDNRNDFLLEPRAPLHVLPGLEIYEGEGKRIFYRGVAVQTPDKPSLYTYNITEQLYLTEDRTAGSWATDPIIARGLSQIKDRSVIDATLTAPSEALESRLDYDYAHDPGPAWSERAQHFALTRPMDIPSTVRRKHVEMVPARVCPTCQRPIDDDE